MKKKIFTLQQIYKEGILCLEEAGIEEAKLDAWYLLEYVTGIGRAAYYGRPDRVIDEEMVRKNIDTIRIDPCRIVW